MTTPACRLTLTERLAAARRDLALATEQATDPTLTRTARARARQRQRAARQRLVRLLAQQRRPSP